MNYKLPSFDLSKYFKVYAGQKTRYATATAVSFINNNMLLAAQFLNRKIYLIDLSNGFDIINQIDMKYYPDIMDYKDNMIITANFPCLGIKEGSVSKFKLENNKILLDKNIKLPNNRTHGCKIVDQNNAIITSGGDNSRHLMFLDLNTESYTTFNDFEFYPKDVYIKDNNRLIVVTSFSRPATHNKVEVKSSFLYLFSYPDLQKIDEFEFNGQTDSVSMSGENGFITLQPEDSLLHFTLKNDKLKYEKLIGGFSFPHGVACFDNKIAISNYGTNSIDVLNIGDII